MPKEVLFSPDKPQTCCRLYFISLLCLRVPFQLASQITLSRLITQAFLQLVSAFVSFPLQDSEFSLLLFPVCFLSLLMRKLQIYFRCLLRDAPHLLRTHAVRSNADETSKMYHLSSVLYPRPEPFFQIIFSFSPISSAAHNSEN